jgi:DNA-binding IclR family transcriptional regulator
VVRRSPAVDRAVALLNFLADKSDQSFTLSELSRVLEMNKATAHSLLATLTEARYVDRDQESMRFTLGPAVIGLGQAVLSRDHLLHLARQAINRLSADSGHPATLVIVVGDELVVVGVADHGHVLSSRVKEGTRHPLVPPIGAPFAAWWPQERVERWLGRLQPPLSDADRDQSRALLDVIRQRGYVVDLNDSEVRLQAFLEAVATGGTNQLPSSATELVNRSAHAQVYSVREFIETETYHVEAVSVPLFDSDGQAAAAITVIVNDRLSGQEVHEIGSRMLAIARGVDRGAAVDNS